MLYGNLGTKKAIVSVDNKLISRIGDFWGNGTSYNVQFVIPLMLLLRAGSTITIDYTNVQVARIIIPTLN